MQNINANTAFTRPAMVAALGRGGTAESGSTMKFMMAYTSMPYNKPERIGRRNNTVKLNSIAAI